MTTPYRIAIGNIFTESNDLAGNKTTLADFERTELRRGAEVLEADDGVVGGALSVLRERDVEIIPTLVTSAYPGGILTANCYLTLKNELVDRLRAAQAVDGVIAPMHGAAAVERTEHLDGDLDGDLLEAIRQTIGPDIPLVATLDLHAHVTEKMVRNANALLAWETYPHRDSFTTGARGAQMLLDILDGKVRPAMALAKVPVLVSAFHGHTEPPGPFADVMQFAKSLEDRPEVASTSALLVHAQLDQPDMGGGGLVITNGDQELATQLAVEIAEMYWHRRFDLEPTALQPADAIAAGRKVDGPVLLIETADCVGGGAAGDSVATLRALLQTDPPAQSLAMVVDPEAAAACRAAGVNSALTLKLGHKVDPRWGQPIEVTGRVAMLTDGRFVYSGGIWGGQYGEMGPSAKFVSGPVEILIATHPTYDWADEQYRSMGMDPSAAKFFVAKNPMNYRVGYGGRYKEAFVLDTPGPTTVVLSSVDLPNWHRPYFPKDREIPGLTPTAYCNPG